MFLGCGIGGWCGWFCCSSFGLFMVLRLRVVEGSVIVGDMK